MTSSKPPVHTLALSLPQSGMIGCFSHAGEGRKPPVSRAHTRAWGSASDSPAPAGRAGDSVRHTAPLEHDVRVPVQPVQPIPQTQSSQTSHCLPVCPGPSECHHRWERLWTNISHSSKESNRECGMLLPSGQRTRPFLYLAWKFCFPFIKKVLSVWLKEERNWNGKWAGDMAGVGGGGVRERKASEGGHQLLTCFLPQRPSTRSATGHARAVPGRRGR